IHAIFHIMRAAPTIDGRRTYQTLMVISVSVVSAEESTPEQAVVVVAVSVVVVPVVVIPVGVPVVVVTGSAAVVVAIATVVVAVAGAAIIVVAVVAVVSVVVVVVGQVGLSDMRSHRRCGERVQLSALGRRGCRLVGGAGQARAVAADGTARRCRDRRERGP